MQPSPPDTSAGDPLVRLGWNDAIAALYKKFDGPDRLPGRVLRVDRGSSLVAIRRGTTRVPMTRDEPPPGAESGTPTTGDWVVIRPDPDEGEVIETILPRRTAILRRDPSAGDGRPTVQVLAANLDWVGIVHGLDRPVQPGRIERFLVIAWESGARPLLVLTKLDLVEPTYVDDTVVELEELAPGVEVLPVSNVTGAGVDRLKTLIGLGTTVALIGASGTGKSSLVNRLAGRDVQSTGDTRRGDGKGKHTTTSRDLIALASGGVLIDTPGLREVGVWGSRQGLESAFDDIASLSASCKFRDCRHADEPACAVREAVESGRLEERRLESYRDLEGELGGLERQAARRSRRPSAHRPSAEPPTFHDDW